MSCISRLTIDLILQSTDRLAFLLFATKRCVCQQQRDEIMRHFFQLVNPLVLLRLNSYPADSNPGTASPCLTFFLFTPALQREANYSKPCPSLASFLKNYLMLVSSPPILLIMSPSWSYICIFRCKWLHYHLNGFQNIFT